MYKEKEQQNQIFASCKSLLNFFDVSLDSYYGSIILLLLPDLGKVYAKVIKSAKQQQQT